jgi:hypothetical protein
MISSLVKQKTMYIFSYLSNLNLRVISSSKGALRRTFAARLKEAVFVLVGRVIEGVNGGLTVRNDRAAYKLQLFQTVPRSLNSLRSA